MVFVLSIVLSMLQWIRILFEMVLVVVKVDEHQQEKIHAVELVEYLDQVEYDKVKHVFVRDIYTDKLFHPSNEFE